MNSNFNTYDRRESSFRDAPTSSSGFRDNNGSGFQGGMQMRPPMGMGMRGGPLGFRGRMQLPFGGGRSGRPFGGVPSLRNGEFGETPSYSNERRMPIVQGRPPMRTEEVPQRSRQLEQVLEDPFRKPRDFSRGGESAKSRPQERSFRNRDQLRSQPKPVSAETQERARESSRNGHREKRLNQSQRSDRPRGDSDAIWVRSDDSAQFYVRLAKMRFYRGKLEEVKIHAAGKNSIYTAFKAVEVLSRYSYVEIGGIKTSKLDKEEGRSISKVEILLKKTPDFEKLFEDFEKLKESRRDEGIPRTARARPSPKQRAQASPTQHHQKEEIKEATPKKPDELLLLEAGSAEAATSAKSQSTPDKSNSLEAAVTTGNDDDSSLREKSLKKDKWWLKGVTGKELGHLEVDDEEPLIFM